MKKGQLDVFITVYKETGDPTLAAMTAFDITNNQIAEIKANELLKKRHIFAKVKDAILAQITDENLKVEFWLTLKKTKDEKNRIRILEDLAEYIGMSQKQEVNIYSGNFTWQQLVSAAHNEKQKIDTLKGVTNGLQKEIKEEKIIDAEIACSSEPIVGSPTVSSASGIVSSGPDEVQSGSPDGGCVEQAGRDLESDSRP